ncbi:MAG: penicillin-binding protein 2 [Myxococcota bacterium]
MTMLSVRREVGEFRKRYKWMALVAVLAFAGLIARMAQLQLVQGDRWIANAQENITKTILLPATRGLIRDVRGRVVASNRPSFVVYITPELLDDQDFRLFANLMGLDEDARRSLRRRLDAVPNNRRMHQIEFFQDIDRDQLASLETHNRDLPGVDVVPRPMRTYPYDDLATHAIGYLNEVNGDDLERLGRESGYRAGDVIGRMGVERWAEGRVRGERGRRRVLVDSRGRRQTDDPALIAEREEHTPPTPGNDLVLTLDMELMATARRAFGGHPSGAVVAVDVNSGRIRALYSKPSYDLNDITGGMSRAAYDALRNDPFRPLIDKTIYESYFPASTFKPISALAGLQDGLIQPSERVECVGYYQIGTDRKRCTSSHGEVDMRSALAQSCNVYFYHLAEQVGLERLNRFGRLFGLGERTGIGINSEARGFLPSRQWYVEHFGRFREGNTLNAAIGQGNTRVTLLQLALAYGALANGGTLYEPQILQSVRRHDGSLVEEFEPRVRRELDLEASHMALIEEGLWGAVNAPNGTAYEARIAGGVMIAGKTGTAEMGPGARRRDVDEGRAWYFNRSHAWFAGYAPADEPQVALVVLVEHGGSGGRAAAPIALRILEDYLGGGQLARSME